jgi:hypothetical protein
MLVKRTLFIWGLAAFVLTLAFSFWHAPRDDAAPAAAAEPYKGSLASADPRPADSSLSVATPLSMATPPPAAAPAPAAAAMEPVVPPAEPVQSDQPDTDNGATPVSRDRGSDRGSRSR